MTTFRNPLADPLGTRRGPPLVRGPHQFENRCCSEQLATWERRRYSNRQFNKKILHG